MNIRSDIIFPRIKTYLSIVAQSCLLVIFTVVVACVEIVYPFAFGLYAVYVDVFLLEI